jgi:hypothetical protein
MYFRVSRYILHGFFHSNLAAMALSMGFAVLLSVGHCLYFVRIFWKRWELSEKV